MNLQIILTSLIVFFTTIPGAWGSGETQGAAFDATLKPRLDSSGSVIAIDVDYTLSGSLAKDQDRLILMAPVVYAGAFGIADRIKDLRVRDRQGVVGLESHDDPSNPAGFPYFRHWTADRAVSFPVEVRYRAEVEPPTDRRGPPFNIKSSKGGVSGGGMGFLVIPENSDAQTAALRWDLDEFAPGAVGVSSFGQGDVRHDGPPSELWQGWYMAGEAGTYPESGDAEGFSAAWLGDYPFDPEEEMKLAAEAYAWLGQFFGYLSPPPRYRVFMRIVHYPIPRFSGTALGSSFMLSGGPDAGESTGGKAPRGTIFHEMIHMWVGAVEAPAGVNSWFSEGLTSYYTLVLPLRGGFEDAKEFQVNVEKLAERYYTSPGMGLSAQAIADVGFSDNSIRETPYVRGTMYFADLDARIRAQSGDRRSLDDLMAGIFEQRHNDPDYRFDHDAWIAAVTEELGTSAGEEFLSRIVAGEPFSAVPEAFGPCFVREAAEFETEGGPVAGFRWVRSEDVPDEDCAGS